MSNPSSKRYRAVASGQPRAGRPRGPGKPRKRRRRGEAQLHLDSLRHGGRREGAGRPKSSDKVGHDTRPVLPHSVPVHVTMRFDRRLRLRSGRLYGVILRAIGAAQGRFSMRVLHWSVQHGHVHLIVEARHRRSLSKGMQGLSIRISKGINRAMGRLRGRVLVDRYHAVQLGTPRQVRHALAYVLNNRRRHLRKLGKAQPGRNWVDPFCSGLREGVVFQALGQAPSAAPRTWLAGVGWKRHGPVRVTEVPGDG
ncbi:MAG: transposase [Myxococcota bacterium]